MQKSTRLTLVGQDGTVLYDSVQDDTTLENHKNRKEIKGAMENGRGEAVRTSDTLGQKTFYYAIRLQDGTVLRASQTIDNVLPTIRKLLPYIIGIFLLMVAGAYLLAKWQTKRLIDPINHLDLEHPLENDVYEELTPLLQGIDVQNREKEKAAEMRKEFSANVSHELKTPLTSISGYVYEELTPLLQGIDVQNREKEKAAEMRKEFSANVSHELKTPLTSISGYAEIMKNGLVRPEDMKGFSERIYNEASRLITLVEDIIKISKLDEKSIELEKQEVDLYLLVREICTRLAPQAEKKSVRFEVSGEHVSYNGIRQILDEMIYNLCENAVKYNVKGGKVSVWTGNTLEGPKVIVEDTGIGIPEEEKERVFERFYRVDKSHSRENGGTGLGLSIVKHGAVIVEDTGIGIPEEEKERVFERFYRVDKSHSRENGGTGLGLSIVKHGALLHDAKIQISSNLGKGTKIELIFGGDSRKETDSENDR